MLNPHSADARLTVAYLAGRVAEVFQQRIYQIVGIDLGHPSKHLLVALATYFMVRNHEFSTREELRSSTFLESLAAGIGVSSPNG